MIFSQQTSLRRDGFVSIQQNTGNHSRETQKYKNFWEGPLDPPIHPGIFKLTISSLKQSIYASVPPTDDFLKKALWYRRSICNHKHELTYGYTHSKPSYYPVKVSDHNLFIQFDSHEEVFLRLFCKCVVELVVMVSRIE